MFERDPVKADANARKHGITFDEATTLRDPLAMLMLDPAHSLAEARYLLLGMSSQQRLIVVAFADRAPRTRLISARRATRPERRKHEEEG